MGTRRGSINEEIPQAISSLLPTAKTHSASGETNRNSLGMESWVEKTPIWQWSRCSLWFMDDISQIQIQNQITDCWIWKPETTGQYSTKSAYYLLQEATVGDTLDEALEDLWKLKISAKAQIFAWGLIKDRLPTKANLRRRQIQMNDTICPFCRSKEEEASHLFFYCPKTQPLWWESLSWTQTMGAFSVNPRQHFMQQPIGINGGKQYSRWKCWWVALGLFGSTEIEMFS